MFQKETKPMSLNKFFAFEIFKLSTSRECKRVTSKKMHSKAQNFFEYHSADFITVFVYLTLLK